MYLFKLIICELFLLKIARGNQNCLPKDYGDNKIVCVCNEKYCDSIKPIGELDEGTFVKYISSESGLRLQQTKGRIEDKPKSKGITLQLQPHKQYQKIIGWGGAFTDAAGINIAKLSEDVQNNLLKSYFSNDGIEYSLCRIPIGGTDFSTHPYEYDEVPNDTALSHFNLTEEDFLYKIPYIQKARNLRGKDLEFFATAWSAPNWMKTNDAITGFGLLKNNLYQVWADYHIKFLEFYKKYGNIEFWGITTGNEPSNGLIPIPSFNNMGWTPLLMRKWVAENLGPTLRGHPEFSHVKIITLDDQRYFLPWWINIVFRNEKAKSYIDGIGVHWYGDGVTPVIVLDWTNQRYPDKFILYTEACTGSFPFTKKVDIGSWDRGESYAQSIISTLNHHSIGWTDWNLALDLDGGPNWAENNVDAPILVNATANEFYKQPMYYALGHFTKFIPRNSVRIGHNISRNNDLDILTTVRPDGRTVVVILNSKNYGRYVSIEIPTKSPQKFINVAVEKRSIATIIV